MKVYSEDVIMLDAVQLTKDLLRFNTINPPGQEEACAQFLGKLLEAAGFRVSYHAFAPTRTSLIATIGGADKPPLCFTGHIDVVPLGAKAWTKDPFAGETEGDLVYGRGSTDMKSGIAAFVVAAIKAAPRLHNTPGLTLIITASEEVGCEGAKYLAQEKLLDRAGAIVVAEPTANFPFLGHKGLMWVEVETTGKTAHGSMPEVGDNALTKMARCVCELERFRFDAPPHPVMGPATMNIATFHSGLNTNSVPDSAKVTIDFRTVPPIDHVHLCHSLQTLLGGNASVRKIVETPPLFTDANDEWVQRVFEITTPYLGERPDARTITFSTDGADLKRGFGGATPAVILGPGEPSLAHQTDEFTSATKTLQSVDIFTDLIKDWTGI